MPLIGWTPTDRTRRWGFSVAKYGAQQQTECTATGYAPLVQPRRRQRRPRDGSPSPATTRTTRRARSDPSFVTGWMAHIAGRVGTAASGRRALLRARQRADALELDAPRRAPDAGVLRRALAADGRDYASAIKAQDPDAQILGPAAWGWCAYFCSALDGCGDGGPDLPSHGGVQFLAWYLQQAQPTSTAHGKRLVDYLDIHYYPQALGRRAHRRRVERDAALRLRSLKSLYDPTYIDESWIGTVAVRPRRSHPADEGWIAAHYPGTKLAISEYNWGNDDGISSRARAGRSARDLRARGRRPRDSLGRARLRQPTSRTRSASTSTTTGGRRVRATASRQ